MRASIQRIAADACAAVCRFVFGGIVVWTAGIPEQGRRVYIANHCSNLDFVLVWSNLPRELRRRTRPVAAEDYWGGGGVRSLFAVHVFRAVLTRRGADLTSDAAGRTADADPAERGREAVARWSGALEGGDALILFPEGTRNPAGEIGRFKTGLYHLCSVVPDLELVPVHLEDVSRALPKGERLPIPMMSRVTFGSPLRMHAGEGRDEFLARARAAVEELAA